MHLDEDFAQPSILI